MASGATALEQQQPNKWSKLAVVTLAYSLWLAATFVAAQLLLVAFVALVSSVGIDLAQYNTNLVMISLGVMTYGLMLAMTVGVPRWAIRQTTTWRELGMHRLLTWTEIGLALAGMVTYFILTAVLILVAQEILPNFDLEQTQEIGISVTRPGLEMALAFLLLVAVGPIVEELLFRGYLYGKLRTRGVPFWLTALVVSVLFGVAHMQWNVGVDTFALSLVMCATREITGTIWPSILMHMMKNGIAFYFLFVNPQILQGVTG